MVPKKQANGSERRNLICAPDAGGAGFCNGEIGKSENQNFLPTKFTFSGVLLKFFTSHRPANPVFTAASVFV